MQLTRGQELALSLDTDLSHIRMSDFICRQLINLVHEELFSSLPQHRSLLLVHRLQVALDFAVVFRCRSTACRCSIRFTRSASSSSGSNFVVSLCSFRRGELVTLGDVPSDCSTCVANFFCLWRRCSTVPPTHSKYCLSWAHTHSHVFPRCRPKSRIACRCGSRSSCTSLIFLVSCGSVMLSALHTSLSSVLFFDSSVRTFGLSFTSDFVTFSSCSCKLLFFFFFREECTPRSQLVPVPAVPIVPSLRLATCESNSHGLPSSEIIVPDFMGSNCDFSDTVFPE